MAKALSIVKVKIGGAYHNTITDSVEFDPGGMVNEEVMADEGHNYQEKPRGSRLKCDFLFTGKTLYKAISEFKEGTLELETNIGKTLSMTNATRMGEPPTAKSSDGRITFEAMGDKIELDQ